MHLRHSHPACVSSIFVRHGSPAETLHRNDMEPHLAGAAKRPALVTPLPFFATPKGFPEGMVMTTLGASYQEHSGGSRTRRKGESGPEKEGPREGQRELGVELSQSLVTLLHEVLFLEVVQVASHCLPCAPRLCNPHQVLTRNGGRLAEQPDDTSESEAGSIGWGGTTDDSTLSSAQTNGEQRRWYKDPRLGILGLRGLFSNNTPPPLVESGKEVDEDYYLLWRLEQGIAEGSVEIPKGEAVPLENNLEGLNAINLDKGCYVGQELVARTHHRGVIRKRLMPLNFVQSNGQEAQEAVTPGAEVVDKKSGKKVGKVTTVLGPRGLGLVRLEAARGQRPAAHRKPE